MASGGTATIRIATGIIGTAPGIVIEHGRSTSSYGTRTKRGPKFKLRNSYSNRRLKPSLLEIQAWQQLQRQKAEAWQQLEQQKAQASQQLQQQKAAQVQAWLQLQQQRALEGEGSAGSPEPSHLAAESGNASCSATYATMTSLLIRTRGQSLRWLLVDAANPSNIWPGHMPVA